MLQRIYGTAFFDKKELDAWLKQQEEAKKRDHRKLGTELDLFHFHPFAPGAAFWTPEGHRALPRARGRACAGCTRENGYVEIKTPLLYNKGLWETSRPLGQVQGEHVPRGGQRDDDAGEHDFSLKPMNCPSHHLFYGITEAQLPRAAAALPHPGRAAPQRGLGHARRPHPRAAVRAGRRAHLLHARRRSPTR